MPPSGKGQGDGSFGGGGRGGGSGPRRQDVCACEANMPLLSELRKLDGECLSMGKQNLRHGVLRAIRSVKLYPLPITTEAEARELEGVGCFMARRMFKGLIRAKAPDQNRSARIAVSGANRSQHRDQDQENVAPCIPSLSRAEKQSGKPARSPKRGPRLPAESDNPDEVARHDSQRTAKGRIPRNSQHSSDNDADGNSRPVLHPSAGISLAANLSALRGEDDLDAAAVGPLTPDVTPRRPTSRARREQEDLIGGKEKGRLRNSKQRAAGTGSFEWETDAPSVFSGCWEAVMIVDNREHECVAVQSALLQKGVQCETRQLPLGDMLWVARRKDAPAPEVLLGYIVERKTASDLASSIVDGRYGEQKRRLKLSGLRRRIYLVEGNLRHQGQLAPAALRTALATSQACGELAVVRCASLRDTLDFLARTHRHVSSLLKSSSSRHVESSASFSGTGPGSGGGAAGTAARTWSIGAGELRWGDSGSESTAGIHAQVRIESAARPSLLHPAMTYAEYESRCAKHASAVTARQVFGAMMRQAPGCSAARAEALVRAFESPLGFLLALERAGKGVRGGRGSQEVVTPDVGDENFEVKVKRGEELLDTLRCSGGAGTNKLPQPMRRLLCQLFMGDSIRAVRGGVAGDVRGGSGVGGLEEAGGVWDPDPMSQDGPCCLKHG